MIPAFKLRMSFLRMVMSSKKETVAVQPTNIVNNIHSTGENEGKPSLTREQKVELTNDIINGGY